MRNFWSHACNLYALCVYTISITLPLHSVPTAHFLSNAECYHNLCAHRADVAPHAAPCALRPPRRRHPHMRWVQGALPCFWFRPWQTLLESVLGVGNQSSPVLRLCQSSVWGDQCSVLIILGAHTCHGRCRQVSQNFLAHVGRCHKFSWHVSAGVSVAANFISNHQPSECSVLRTHVGVS